jgi:hypothetical protein
MATTYVIRYPKTVTYTAEDIKGLAQPATYLAGAEFEVEGLDGIRRFHPQAYITHTVEGTVRIPYSAPESPQGDEASKDDADTKADAPKGKKAS